MGDERTSEVPWNLQCPISSSQTPSLRALQYLSSRPLLQCEECNQMQIPPPPLFAQCFTHTLIVVGNSIASFCSVGMVLPKVYTHTHTHTLFWTSTKFNQKTILFFLLCLISPSTSQGLKQYGVFCCFVLFFYLKCVQWVGERMNRGRISRRKKYT